MELIDAVRRGNISKVRELLGNGIDVNTRDKEGRTALMNVVHVRQNYLEIIRCLLEAGADVNMYNNYTNTLLIEACWYGCIDIVREILLNENSRDKIDWKYKNGRGMMALNFAVDREHSEIVKYILYHVPPSKIYLHIDELINNVTNGETREILEKYRNLLNYTKVQHKLPDIQHVRDIIFSYF